MMNSSSSFVFGKFSSIMMTTKCEQECSQEVYQLNGNLF